MRRRELLLTAATALRAANPGSPVRLHHGEMALYSGAEWDKPFLYPIQTVSGKKLSRGYPLETASGEQTDHAWHRGIWYGHGIINGHDFWRELGRGKTARIVPLGEPVRKKRGARQSVTVVGRLTPPFGEAIGTVRQQFTVQDTGALRAVDALITLSADQRQPLTFGDTDDGGFAIRLSDAFRQDRGALLRNSNGAQGAENLWGRPAHWVDYAAVLDGTPCGVAIFDHPANLRHPTAWHARGYSLNAANPFAAKAFSKGKATDGGYTLTAGGRLVLRYRVVIHEGPFEPAAIEAAYRAWAR